MGCFALGAVAASSELFTLCLAVSLALRETASSTLARLYAAGKTEEAATFAALRATYLCRDLISAPASEMGGGVKESAPSVR